MIVQHTCPVCGSDLEAQAEIDRLRSRLQSLEATNARTACPTPANVTRLPAARKTRLAPDYRTAAETWLAGEVLSRPKKAEYRKGESKPVAITFADGVVMRVSTYLDGQAGLNEAGRFARASRQARPNMVETLRRRARGEAQAVGRWVRDSGGAWRLVNIQPCPDIVDIGYSVNPLAMAAE